MLGCQESPKWSVGNCQSYRAQGSRQARTKSISNQDIFLYDPHGVQSSRMGRMTGFKYALLIFLHLPLYLYIYMYSMSVSCISLSGFRVNTPLLTPFQLALFNTQYTQYCLSSLNQIDVLLGICIVRTFLLLGLSLFANSVFVCSLSTCLLFLLFNF